MFFGEMTLSYVAMEKYALLPQSPRATGPSKILLSHATSFIDTPTTLSYQYPLPNSRVYTHLSFRGSPPQKKNYN